MNKLLKRFFPFIIPAFLLLNAGTPRLNALLASDADIQKSVLVYSFVWVPILEISVMIAEHILPSPSLSAEKNNRADTAQPETKVASIDLINVSGLKNNFMVRLFALVLPLLLLFTGTRMFARDNLLNSFHRDRPSRETIPITRIFLLSSILPRSDNPSLS